MNTLVNNSINPQEKCDKNYCSNAINKNNDNNATEAKKKDKKAKCCFS